MNMIEKRCSPSFLNEGTIISHIAEAGFPNVLHEMDGGNCDDDHYGGFFNEILLSSDKNDTDENPTYHPTMENIMKCHNTPRPFSQ